MARTFRASSLLLGLFGLLALIIILSLGKKTLRPTPSNSEASSESLPVLRQTQGEGGGREIPLAIPPTETPGQLQPVVKAPASTTAIAGKAYQNSQLGFSFRYPDSWTVSEERKPTQAKFLHLSVGSTSAKGSPGLDLFVNDLGRSFESYSTVVEGEKEVKIAGVGATQGTFADSSTGRESVFVKLVSPKGDNYLFAFSYGQGTDVTKEISSILNTFRFE